VGKLLGIIVGLILGFGAGSGWAAVVLALVGCFAGQRFDALHRISPQTAPERLPLQELLPDPQTRAEIEVEARVEFARHLAALFAALAQVDGAVSTAEAQSVRRYFQNTLSYSGEELSRVLAFWEAALATPPLLREAARQCLESLGLSERAVLFSALAELAVSDGPLNARERETLADLAERLAIPELDRHRILNHGLDDAAAVYGVLEVSPDASDAQVKASFRRLATVHHPDKVAHLGPHAVQSAGERFRQLREAYERIRALRGF
jgi:DnaJ like chaperone protein